MGDASRLSLLIFFFLLFFISALSRKRISVMTMLGVYLVLGVGMVVAFLVLIAEILWKLKMTSTTRVKFLNRRFVCSFLVMSFINLTRLTEAHLLALRGRTCICKYLTMETLIMLMHLNSNDWLTVNYEQSLIFVRVSKASDPRELDTERLRGRLHASAPTKTASRRVSAEFQVPRLQNAQSSTETLATEARPVREQGYSFLSSELRFF